MVFAGVYRYELFDAADYRVVAGGGGNATLSDFGSDWGRATTGLVGFFHREAVREWDLFCVDDASGHTILWHRNADDYDRSSRGGIDCGGSGDANETGDDYCDIWCGGIRSDGSTLDADCGDFAK